MLCKSTKPFLGAARRLMGFGFDPSITLVMRILDSQHGSNARWWSAGFLFLTWRNMDRGLDLGSPFILWRPVQGCTKREGGYHPSCVCGKLAIAASLSVWRK